MKILTSLLLISFPCFGEIDSKWLKQAENNIDKEAIKWLREGLQTEIKKTQINDISTLPIKKCRIQNSESTNLPSLLVFISFSVSDNTWLSLSKELTKLDGVFVLRGIPNNSFQELSEKILRLKNLGMHASIQVDPLLFDKYHVNQVPTIVVREGETFDDLSGNVSIHYALNVMKQNGDTDIANSLFENLQKRDLLSP